VNCPSCKFLRRFLLSQVKGARVRVRAFQLPNDTTVHCIPVCLLGSRRTPLEACQQWAEQCAMEGREEAP
jgi:hypothetical protein